MFESLENERTRHYNKKVLLATLAGAISGSIEICIAYPMEFVKTQLQLCGARRKILYEGGMDVVTKTVQEKGILGLYRGFPIMLLGTTPRVAVRFGSYEIFKNFFRDESGKIRPGI